LISFVFGLFIYVSYLYPNLQWYYLNNEWWDTDEEVVAVPTDEMETSEVQAEL